LKKIVKTPSEVSDTIIYDQQLIGVQSYHAETGFAEATELNPLSIRVSEANQCWKDPD
jgi:hypothetical protein